MSDASPMGVVLGDDHYQTHRIAQSLLDKEADIELVAQGANGQEGVSLCQQFRPDIVLMDVVMPIMDGIQATEQLGKRLPEVKILVPSSFQYQESVHAMLQNGPVGYLTKGSLAQALAERIRATFHGKMVFSKEIGAHLTVPPQPRTDFHLTDRQLEVLLHLEEGLPNQQSALRLSNSQSTLKYHMANIYRNLGAQTRSEALVLAVKNNLL